MKVIQDFLRLSDLPQYMIVFEDMGYDSVGHLAHITHKELMNLRQITNMKTDHFTRMLES